MLHDQSNLPAPIEQSTVNRADQRRLFDSVQQGRNIGWGILGSGRVTSDFARGLKIAPHATLRGIASRSPAKTRQLGAILRCQSYDSYDQLLQDPLVDVVYIATPPHCHMSDCLKALEHGKAIVCEKPFALSVAQAETVIECARSKGLFCMEAMWMRFMPLVTKIGDLISSGSIGRPLAMCGDFAYPLAPDPKSNLFNPKNGGGALYDRGIYLLSLAHAILGKPERITSHATVGATGVDEQCAMTLHYRSGAIAQFFVSLRTLGTNTVHIAGEHGSIHVHPPFYRPHRISVSRFTPASPLESKSHHLHKTHYIGRKIAESRIGDRAVGIIKSLSKLLPNPHKSLELRQFPGNGYHFEAAEATHCLLQGVLESPSMPHLATIEVLSMLEAVRGSWT